MQDKQLDNAIVDPRSYADEATYHGLFGRLRRDDPVHWAEPDGFRPFWALSKYADIIEVERQNRCFLSAPALRLLSTADRATLHAIAGYLPMRTIISMDEPDHRAYRRLTQSWFLPGTIAKLEADITRLAHAAIDRMAELGGECEFVHDVAASFPLRIVMHMLGLPPTDERYLLNLTHRLFTFTDPDLGGDLEREMAGYFAAITADRRRHPRDDIASVIANAEIDGKPIGEREASSYYAIIATGGNHTATASLAGGLLALTQNPDQMAKLREDATLLPVAVQEMIRIVSPVKHVLRTAAVHYELRGRQIRPGDALMLCFPSANRDEEIFDDPFAFRIGRPETGHLAFGHGPHICLGQHLAALEMRIFFKVLLDRLKHVELAGAPAWTASSFMSGPKRLPIRYRL